MTQTTPRRPRRGLPRSGKSGPAQRLTGGISMWGAPSSGKTTFAATMAVALERHPDEPWRLRGTDGRSSDELGRMRDALVDRGEFPAATMNEADYNWELVKPDPRAGRRGLLGLPRRDRTVRVPLHLVDGPGRHQNPERWLDTPAARKLVETMATCNGFIFIYDPVSEVENGDAYHHTSSLLARLDYLLGDRPGGYLPQSLAVCVAKFDDERVYASAIAARVVDHDYAGDESPYVDEDKAGEFFDRICRASPNPAAQDLPGLLRRHFHPERITFYVTSAIGFHVSPGTNRFDPDDFVNVIREPGQKVKIRGAIRPINVMEPMLWLTRKMPRPGKQAERPQQ